MIRGTGDFMGLWRHALQVLALLLWVEATGFGDVFLQVPKSPRLVLRHLGGQSLQRTETVVNGLGGRMTVFGFEQSVPSLCGALGRALGLPGLAQAGASGAFWMEWPVAGSLSAQVFLLPGAPGQALALVLECPPEAAAAAPVWPWPDGSLPPGFSLRFSAVQDRGRVALVTGTLAQSAGMARLRLDEHLRSEGWIPETPASAVLSSALYSRNGEILVATVLPADEVSGDTRAAMLRRRADARTGFPLQKAHERP